MNCKKITLSECIEIIGGGTPKTSKKEYWGGEIPWLSVVDFNNDNRYVSKTEKTITQEGLNNCSSRLLGENDIILSARGTVGALAQLSKPMAFNQSCYGIRANELAINDYIYYLLKHSVSILKKNSYGSVFDTITRETFSRIEVLLPDLKIQKRISEVLGSLDNKIELNEKINQNLDWEYYFSICRKIIELEEENQNLEAQAQAIFKSWFVDFEPFGGKMPADWGQGCLSDVLSVIESGSRPKGGSESSGVPSIGAENIDGIGHYDYSKEKYINRDFFQNLRHGKVNSGDILLYKDGAYVGKVSMALNGFPHEICAVNEHVFILRTNEQLPSQSYLYLFFAQHSIRNKIATLGSAKAAQPGVNQSDIKGISLTIPNKGTIQAFENIASSLFFKIVQNSIQSRRLAQLRDALLPKLMSGEIDVSDVAV